jgi:hypothetical protein
MGRILETLNISGRISIKFVSGRTKAMRNVQDDDAECSCERTV